MNGDDAICSIYRNSISLRRGARIFMKILNLISTRSQFCIQMAHQQSQGYTEYRVKLTRWVSRSSILPQSSYFLLFCSSNDKTYHVMRFKPPHKCDLEKLVNVSHIYTIDSPFIYCMCIFLQPTLDRQMSKAAVEEPASSLPTEGEGSEYGRKWKDEVRKKRRGYSRRQDPDDNPWVLKEKKRGGKQ